MPSQCLTVPPSACIPPISDPRVLDSFYRRFTAATRQALVPVPAHTTNGDENYPDKCASYSKCIKQDSPGKVNLAAFAGFTSAIAIGSFAAFQGLALGGSRTLNGPMGSYAPTFLGADSSQFGMPLVPPPPALASRAYAAELVELYWASLLRDVPFSDYHKSSIAHAAARELSSFPEYQGPRDGNDKVIPALLFRGPFTGETIGPYLSQFLITPTDLGALPFPQKYITYKPGIDYMTDTATWFDVQNGIPTGLTDQPDPTPRYLHNGRGLAAYTHVDELYQAYFTAYLVLNSLKAPFNPGNPYVGSMTQNGFGTFGDPDIAAVLAQVAKIALNAVWFQKWVVHLRHRPEAGGGLVHFIKNGATFSGQPDNSVLDSKAVQESFDKYGSYLLSQTFPEGSPSHPAYPTGHGAVAGACITVLKFFFDGSFTLNDPQVPSQDGQSLEPWKPDPETGNPGVLTVDGELHKLAHNVSFGHGIHAGIHWRSDTDVSIRFGEAVALSFFQDLACTYAEPFTINLTTIDGQTATITNV